MNDAAATVDVPSLTAGGSTVPLHDFQADELFFSITDSRGIIEHANGVFVRLSGYPFEVLKQQPHNIVRSPAMPRGAFRLIWDELVAGRTVASYVANQSRDGVRYEVFAVQVPIENGFLSIRVKPEIGGLRDLVFDIFDRARAVEARTPGGARQQASAGAAFILAELAERGIADMAALTRRTLAREVAATLNAVSEIEAPSGRDTLEVLLRKIHLVSRLLLEPLRSLEHVDTVTMAGAGAAQPSDQFSKLRLDVEVLAQQIAVFALQNQMIGRFASELLRGAAVEPPGQAMRLLHQTLTAHFDELNEGIERVNRQLGAATEIDERIEIRIDAQPIQATLKFIGMVTAEID